MFSNFIVVVIVDSDSHNDVPPEAQRNVTIAVLQGAIRPSSSSSIRVADIIRLFFLDYTTLGTSLWEQYDLSVFSCYGNISDAIGIRAWRTVYATLRKLLNDIIN